MISSTSTDVIFFKKLYEGISFFNVNANINPVNADVIKVDFIGNSDDPEIVKDWSYWTLMDIVRILRDMAKPEKCYGITAVVMGNIVFHKLLEAAKDPNVPFEVIEETYIRLLKHRYA